MRIFVGVPREGASNDSGIIQYINTIKSPVMRTVVDYLVEPEARAVAGMLKILSPFWTTTIASAILSPFSATTVASVDRPLICRLR